MLKLKVCYAVSELKGLIKSGILADVAEALPRELARQGHDVTIFLPGYSKLKGYSEAQGVISTHLEHWPHTPYEIKKLIREDLTVYLIDAPHYFGRDEIYTENGAEYSDNGERFAFFCAAVLDGVIKLGIRPDIIHANDWHTGLIPFLLKSRYKAHSLLSRSKSILTVHSALFQGVFPAEDLEVIPELFKDGKRAFVSHSHIGMLKAGIAFADKINAVSPNYASELKTSLGSHGLEDEFNRRSEDFCGITNGCDYREWNPRTDQYIPVNYNSGTDSIIKGKRAAKTQLLKEVGLTDGHIPVFGMVCNLSQQKGFGYVIPVLEQFLANDVRLVILGSGEAKIARKLRKIEQRYHNKLCLVEAYSDRLAHMVEAGSDFFLMPSEYEACGMNQMYSMAYGTLPVVREVGGLKDTVRDVDVHPESATGFSFHYPIAKDLLTKMQRAVIFFYQHPTEMLRVQKRAMSQDFNWSHSAKQYTEMYLSAINR